ncbi:unnamed protein product [Linum tenue]|uniref:F-ATPase gamma subunit n=1 Tax=Linum tenue TaxID=586396 RepID=A0AAV0PDH9_9ROSI|nr:unnamed protein product [Linum tenue]
MTETDQPEESPPMAGENGSNENEDISTEEEEEEEDDLDFNPFLKGTPSPEASSSLSSEVEALDDASSPKPTGEVQNFPVGDSEHGEEVVMQTSCSPEEGEKGQFGRKRSSSQQDELSGDFDDEDAICKRTRARYSLASFTLDELENFLQGTDDEDDLQNVDDEEEYRKFLAAVLHSGDGDEQPALAEEIGDDENDADFEIELEELLESDVDDSARDKDRKIKTRQNRSARNKKKNKKLLEQTKRPLRPLLPSLPNGGVATFPSSCGKVLALEAAAVHQPSENPLINGFTPQQIGQLHCLIHEHLQLLIQVFCLCFFDSSRKHIVTQIQGFISEILHKCSEVGVWRSLPFPDICFNPRYMRPSVTDELINSEQTAESFWVPCVRGQVVSILDVAPLHLVGKFIEDTCNAAKEYQRRCVESSFDGQYKKEPLFQLPYLPSPVEANGDPAAPLTPGQELPKKTLAASIVERAKKQSIALVPRDVSKLAQRFFPFFNPALFPYKPPPTSLSNRILFTDAEDELLALGMMEFNTDWEVIQQRFLPCKSKHQIYVRQKNRCSSKAPENPIKAVRRMKASPLRAEEIERIQEALRVYKMDWMSIWKFIVPHRDPSLLPRQWRLALGTQKSYKQDAAQKERRKKYAFNRRSKAADLLNQKTTLDKELYRNNSQKVRDNIVDNQTEAYVHRAFLADWPPVSSYPPLPANLMGKCLPADSLRQAIRTGKQLNVSVVPGESPHQNIYNHQQPGTTSPFSRSAHSPTTTNQLNQEPVHGMTSADIPKPTMSLWPYRTRKKIGTRLVKLAPELPTVNLPPSVRVLSESAFRSNHSGAISRVSSTKPGSGKDDSAPQLLEDERVNDSELQMHPLLFKSSEAEGSLYNPSKSTTAGSSSSFSFFSGNPPHLNLSLFHNPRHVGDCSAKSIRTEECSSSASGGIDFHPLLQQADDGNSNLVMPVLNIYQSNAIGPIEKGHELDLEIHLSSASRNKKNRVTRDGGGSVNQSTSAKGTIKRPMAKDSRVSGATDSSRLESNNADSSTSSKGRSYIEDMGCQSLQEIVMEQEELSDSDEEFEENVEFECEEMADSEGEEGSGCKSIGDRQDETGNLKVSTQEVVSTNGKHTCNQTHGNSSAPEIGSSSSPLLKKLSLTMLGKDKKSNTWLSLDSGAPNEHDDAAPGHQVESGPSGQQDVTDMAQQLSLGPLASSTAKKSRGRATRGSTNLNSEITDQESFPESTLAMACSNLTMWASSKTSLSDASPLSFRSSVSPFQIPSPNSSPSSTSRPTSVSPVQCNLRELRTRIESVKNTQKITEAMKLVAAAKVRRAQEAVVNGRPFSETLVEVLYNINEQLQTEDVDAPLTKVRPVKKVALVVVTGDRGLCGGFNNQILKKAENRMKDLKALGIEFTLISVGKKGNTYFSRRPYIPVDRFLEGTNLPTAKDAQAIADDVFSLFVSEEVDKVELLYTKFVSLVKSDPVIHTLLPLSPKGEICDINGVCVDAAEDEFFRLTTKEGKLTVERDIVRTATPDFSPILQFEQDPVQILDALLPLYLNSQILKALQESLASELAARMSAMSNATDNASELKKTLSNVYNRRRQAKITGEILEIVAGADALV